MKSEVTSVVVACFVVLLRMHSCGGSQLRGQKLGTEMSKEHWDKFRIAAKKLMHEKLATMREVLEEPDKQRATRKKREAARTVTRLEDDIFEFTGVSPFASLNLPYFKDVEVAAYDDFLLVSVVTGDTFELQNKTVVYKVYQNATVEYLQLLDPVDLAVQTTAIFKNKGEVRLALAGDTGVYIFEFHHADSQFYQIQHISASNVFLVEQVVLREVTFMIVGLTGSENMTSGPHSSFALYRWEGGAIYEKVFGRANLHKGLLGTILGGHFDNFFEYSVPYLTDLCPFQIHSHYLLAVAVRDPSNVEYPDLSIIMRFDHHTSAFIVDQYVTTHGARDWEYFQISEEKDQEHFLVLASDGKDESGSEKSTIYKYIWHKFVPFQCISTIGAKKWQVVTRGTDVLVVLSSRNGIDFFQYDGWRFSVVTISPMDNTLTKPVQSFSAAKVNDTDFLAVASAVALNDSSSYTIFQLEFNQTNPLSSFHTILEVACEAEISKLHEANLRVESIKSQLSNLVYVDTNHTQIITGNITFTGNVTTDTADVFGKISAAEGHIFNTSEAKQFEDMKEQVGDLAESVDWLQTRINNTMKKVGDTQIVTAEKRFKDLTSTSTLEAGAVIVTSDFVNGHINLTDLNENVFRKSNNATVQVPITLNGSMVAKNDLQVNGYIDGVPPGNLVTVQGNHTIEGTKHFQQPTNFSADLDVEGLVDGVNISSGTVLLTSTNQTVNGALTFTEKVTFEGDVIVDGEVDGVDISDFVKRAVFKNKTHSIQGVKSFTANVTSSEGLSIESGKTIDGVDLEELDRNALKISGEQNITGDYTFEDDIQIQGDVSVEGTVNNLQIPEDILLANSPDEFTITGPITFTENLTVSDLTVGQSIDGIAATESGTNLDVLLISAPSNSDQVVSGNITFMDDIHLNQDTLADGLVDGVDLSELSLEAVRKDEDSNITGFKTFQDRVKFQEDIQLEGTLSDVNITDLDARVLKVTDAWSPIGELVFTALATNFGASLETSNQHSFRGTSLADLALQGEEETIGGQKAFQTISSESSINFTDHLNGVSLDRICDEAIFLNGTNAVILSGNVTFEEELKILGDLNVNGTIDGLNLDDAVTVFGTQIISSDTEFHSPVSVGNLNVNGSIHVRGNVNGDNVTEIVQDTLFVYGNQTVTGDKTFINDLIFGGDLGLDGAINDVDISDLALDAVYKTGNHTISAGKVFTSKATVDSLNIEGLVNGANFSEFVEDIVIQDQNQTIYGDVTFQGSLRVNSSLTLNGTLNGLDLEDFNASVHKISDSEFTGSLHFADIYANDSVDVQELTNDIDIGRDTLLKSKENQTVSGEKVFSSSVFLEKDLNSSTVNGLDIEDLDDSILKNIGDQNVTGYYKFWEGITLYNNMTLGGLIDGVDIAELANSIWRTDNLGEYVALNVTGKGTFNFLNTNQEIYYNGTLDGVDLRELNRTYVSRSRDQVITGSKQFVEKVIVDDSSNLRTPQIEIEGTVNGVDLQDVADRAFISGNSGQEVEGILTFLENVTFEADVDVDGTVDGISISNDVMRTHRTNIVRAHKNFSYPLLEIMSSLSMKPLKKVQQVDISEWRQQSADILNNYFADYDTKFADVKIFENLIVDGLLNGINYSTEYLLTVPHNQTVYGDFTFLTDTVFEGDMTATTINGLDMVDLATNTLFTTGEQTVAGSITFASEMYFNHVTTHGKLGGVRVPDFWRRIHIYPDLDSFNKSIEEQCGVLDELFYSQQYGAVIFRGLEPIQVETTVGDVQWAPYKVGGEPWVALSVSPVYDNYRDVIHPDTCGYVLLKRWNASDWQYVDEIRLTFDVVKDVKVLEAGNMTCLVIAEQTVGKGCENISDIPDTIVELPATGPPGVPLTGSSWVHVILTDGYITYHQRLLGVGTSTVDTFKTPSEEICVFVGNMYNPLIYNTAIDSFIYCTPNMSSGFNLTAAVPTFGISKVTHFTFNGLTHILVGNRLNSEEQTFEVNSTLWMYDQRVLSQVDSVPTRAVADVVAGTIDGQLLLVFVNEFTGGWLHEDFSQTVDIYRFLEGGTELYQKIDAYGAKSAAFFSLERMDFLAVLDRNAQLKIYKYEGIMQFEEEYSVHIPGATGLWVNYLPLSPTVQIFVATYQGEVNIFPWQPSRPIASPSQIFEVVSSGVIYPAIGCTVE